MTNRKFIIAVALLAVLVIVVLLVVLQRTGTETKYRVGITQFVTHPALDDLRKGIESYLRSKFKPDEIEIIFRNADADFSAASKIAKDFCSRKLDIIIPITTVSAQPIVKACQKTPIVFSGVTDPVGAGLVKSLASPGGNVTGTSDLWPFADQFAMIRKVMPMASTVGYLYNPGEPQAQFALNKVREAAKAAQLQLIERQVDSTSVVRKTALDAANSADLFYYGMDNTVGQAFDSLLKVCFETQKPLFAGDSESVKKGALLCLGIDHEELGIMTGKIVEQVLSHGKEPGSIDVWQVTSGTLFYNSSSFKKFNIELPQFIVKDGKDIAQTS